MSDSEYDFCNTTTEATDNKVHTNRKSMNDKRKPAKKSASMIRKKTRSDDIFNISSGCNGDEESRSLPSFVVNRVATGNERRTTNMNGNYYIDFKIYHVHDVENTDPQELWKKALMRIKFQTDMDSLQWRKTQEFVHAVDALFDEKPKLNKI